MQLSQKREQGKRFLNKGKRLFFEETVKKEIKLISQQQLLYNKPISRQVNCTNLLIFLAQLSPINKALYQSSTFSNKQHQPIIALSLAKEISSRQKRLYMNAVTQQVDKKKVFINLRNEVTTVSYIPCARLNTTTLNTKKNTKKISKQFTKQIENFRSDIRLLTPLNLLISRNFSDPIGINYVSALDNQLAKAHYRLSSKNLLFTRTSKNVLGSNYMNKQTGLIRLKDAIFFDFSYTKESLGKLGLKKTNTLMQQLLETGHQKLWLRKGSSIRL